MKQSLRRGARMRRGMPEADIAILTPVFKEWDSLSILIEKLDTALSGERGLTYAVAPPRGSRIVAGDWWPSEYRGPPLISFDSELAHGMGLAVGDTLTVNLLGREITGRIANLRRIEWARLGINFAIVSTLQ